MIVILVPAYTNFLLQNTLFHKMGNKFSPKCVSLSKISFSFSCLHSTEVVEIHLHTYMAAAAKGKRKYIFKYTLQLQHYPISQKLKQVLSCSSLCS